MRVRPYGDRAVIADLDDSAAVVTWAGAVRRAAIPGVADVVPAARTVLVVAKDGAEISAVAAALARVDVRTTTEPTEPQTEEVVVAVRYDGPDLAEVAERTGLPVDQVVAAHTGTPWRVAFGGFAPGFAYLVGGDPRLEVPRRAHPRTAVPAGAVGLAGSTPASTRARRRGAGS